MFGACARQRTSCIFSPLHVVKLASVRIAVSPEGIAIPFVCVYSVQGCLLTGRLYPDLCVCPPACVCLLTDDVPMLVASLIDDSILTQGYAARALADLAAKDGSSKDAIAMAGAIEPLVQLLNSDSAYVQVEAVVALRYLAAGHTGNQDATFAAGAITRLVELLSSRATDVQGEACVALWCLVLDNDCNKAAAASAGAGEGIRVLLATTKEPHVVEAASNLMDLGLV